MGKVIFLGVEGVGKSTLIVGLANYLLRHPEHGWSLRPETRETFAFSERMIGRFSDGEMPAQTVRFRRLVWSLCHNGEAHRTVEVLDFPGELSRLAFLDPVDDPNPAQLAARQESSSAEISRLMAYLAQADQVFLLFNLNDAKDLATNDANLDAVWLAVSALKVLGGLKQKPEVSLLITQADRLIAEGADLSDIPALLNHRVPLLGQHFKNLNASAVSALDPENADYGLRPIFAKLLQKTDLYKLEEPKWKEFLEKYDDDLEKAKELFPVIAPSARTFAWAMPSLKLFADEAFEQELRLCCEDLDAIRKIKESDSRYKLKIAQLTELQSKCKTEQGRTRAGKAIEMIEEDRRDARGCLVAAIACLLFLTLVILCAR